MESSKNYWEHKFKSLFEQDNKDGSTVHFEYIEQDTYPVRTHAMGLDAIKVKKTTVRITTFNPKKGASFLLMEVGGKTAEEAIENAYQELLSMYKQDSYQSYSLEWGKKEESGKTHVSYFYAKNEFEVLRKFYAEMPPDSTIFYSLKVNPIS